MWGGNRTVVLACLVACLTACASAPRPREAWTPPAAAAEPDRIRVPARPEPVALYNPPPGKAAGLDGQGQHLLDALKAAARRRGFEAPEPDRRLCRAADVMALGTHGMLSPPHVLVAQALAREGLVETDVSIMTGRLAGDSVKALEQISEQLGSVFGSHPVDRLGIGTRTELGTFTVFVVVTQRVRLDVEPFPKALAPGAKSTVRLRPRAPYSKPAAYLTGLDGDVTSLPVKTVDAGWSQVDVVCPRAEGPMQLEVMVEDKGGPSIGLNVPLWCGPMPSDEIDMSMPDPDRFRETVDEAERELLDLVNRERARAGLRALALHRGASNVARRHSEDMVARGVVGHISPVTGSPFDRLRAAGLASPFAAENVASSASVLEVHAGLLASPGHRHAIMAPEATHLGVGVALARSGIAPPQVFATELFLGSPPPDVAPASAGSATTTTTTGVRITWVQRDVEGCRVLGMSNFDVRAGWRQDKTAQGRADAEITKATRALGGDAAFVTELRRRGELQLSVMAFACGAR